MRGATVGPGDIPAIEKPFQSTHPMRGATSNTPRPPIDHGISIHAPHAGRDLEPPLRIGTPERFQSTRPVRGATCATGPYRPCQRHFNPRAPCGARRRCCPTPCAGPHFNPRAPCGARPYARSPRLSPVTFQSTRPVRGATGPVRALCFHPDISIHAPRAGRDWNQTEREGK